MLQTALLLYCVLGWSPAQGTEQPTGKYLFQFPAHAAPERVGRLVVEDLLARDTMIRADRKGIHYAEIATADGAINFADLIGDEHLSSRLEARYACFLEKADCALIPPTPGHRYQAALVVFAMYKHNRDPRYLDVTLDLVQDQWQRRGNPYEESELFRNARFWSDDMYFTPTLDPRIYGVTGEQISLDRPAAWLSGYIDRLQLPNGLFRHTTRVPFIWARGVGWSATGLTNTLQEMPEDHPQRQTLLESYRKLMAGLKPYQSANGLWRQLIDDPGAWEETSGTAMFTYALATGIREGWISADEYGPVLEKAWLGLVEKLNGDGRLEDVCIGTNEKMTAQGYLDRRRETGDHHGQAPLLWTASALLLLSR